MLSSELAVSLTEWMSPQMRYCTNCLLPDTRPNLVLDDSGVCNACSTHAARSLVDWSERQKDFTRTIDEVLALNREYDCVIPVSGGKDSTWQAAKCLELGLKPLAVTWRTPGRTPIGQRNLDNLMSLGLDHVDFTINPKIEREFMLKTFREAGSTAIPMHLAIFSIPLRIAVRLSIPLVVYGENSAAEYGGRREDAQSADLDDHWVRSYGVTQGTTALDWADEALPARSLESYLAPSRSDLARANVRAVFLGHYFPWNPQMTRDVAQKFGFEARTDGPLTGYFDFADIDDDFIAVHHWLKWFKFGFTRTYDNLSLDIRNGLLSRDQALAILRDRGDETPRRDIESFCRFSGIEVQEAFDIAESFRNPDVWSLREDGVWTIPDFLFDDWKWS